MGQVINRMKNPKFIALIVVVVLSVSVYANTLLNGFVYDDDVQIVANEKIKEVANLPDAFFSSISTFIGEEHTSNYYRPFMYIGFMLEYYLFGLDPRGFHLVNVLINALNTALFFLIALALWETILKRDAPLPPPCPARSRTLSDSL